MEENWLAYMGGKKIEANGALPSMCDEVQYAFAEELPALSSPEKGTCQQSAGDGTDIEDILTFLSTPSFTIEPCSKTRGETYLVKEKHLTTKRGQWIPIKVNGVLNAQTIRISLRYEDVNYQDSNPVLCHNNCIITNQNLAAVDFGTSAFCVRTADLKIFLPSSNGIHPSINIDTSDSFHILFRCWNSCDSHKKFGKNRFLLLETLDISGKTVEEKFTLRVCESIKRDHHESVGGCSLVTKKRKPSFTDNASPKYSGSPDSTIVLEINEDENQIIHSAQNYFERKPILLPLKKEPMPPKKEMQEPFVCQTICAKMKCEADEALLKQVILRLNGEYTCI